MTVKPSGVSQQVPAPRRVRAQGATDRVPGTATRRRKPVGWWIGLSLVAVAVAVGFWMQRSSGRQKRPPTVGYTVVNAFPHDPRAYSQGLIYHGGFLYESTGNFGASSLRKVELTTGLVLQQHDLAADLFGEGIALWNDQIVQLTWKNRQAIIYELATFAELRRHNYQGEGWGLTYDGQLLIMSDGTSTLRFLDPETFRVRRQVVVREGNRRISQLNELEFVEGEVYANIWYEDRIARIDPATGQIVGWLDLTGLFPASRRPHRDAVLNGIAYDPQGRRLFVTGKHWPQLFEIRPAR